MIEPRAPTWLEVDAAALQHNIRFLRQGAATKLGVVVKADAYGHGMATVVPVMIAAGVDWLIVNSAAEATAVRAIAANADIYCCGPLLPWEAEAIVVAHVRTVVSTIEVIDALQHAAVQHNHRTPVHIKIETGTTRQGVPLSEALLLAARIRSCSHLVLEGLTTHFADIEDTTDHRFADNQQRLLQQAAAAFAEAGHAVPMVHSANSAATLVDARSHGDMVRVGIAAYGLWPSKETLSAMLERRPQSPQSMAPTMQGLMPVLSWRTRVAQVKHVAAGAYVGYGRSFRTTHASMIAIVPVGYHEGYDRRLSNVAHVLVRGVRAPVRGRVCMNMMMIDVTDVPGVALGDAVTLIGRDGDEDISADQLAGWMGSIHYEVVARLHPSLPRLLV